MAKISRTTQVQRIRLVHVGAVVLAAACFSSNLSAAGFGQATTITGYYIYAGGTSAWIKTAANQNPDSCTSASHLYLDPSSPAFREIWASVMFAFASGSTVSVEYNGCSPGGQYPRITAVAIPQVW